MSHTCTPILVGMTSFVSEILVPSKMANFKLIDRNRLKKFMQVEIDVTYMYTNFGGLDFFCFGGIGTFKNGQFSLSDHGL